MTSQGKRHLLLIALATAIILCSGCTTQRQWIQKHPKATLFIAGSIALSLKASNSSQSNPDVQLPSQPNCTNKPETCK